MSLEVQLSRIGAERSRSGPDHTFGGKEEGKEKLPGEEDAQGAGKRAFGVYKKKK